MKSLFIIFFFNWATSHEVLTIDQKPDLLIIGHDTILLKSFPLEILGFNTRPFTYGNYDFPGKDCYRGYQAIWKVVGNKLFLADIVKADNTQEKIDKEKYFIDNQYSPIVIDGLIFADWFTMDLTSYPRDLKYFGCVWKSKTKRQKASIRFRNGVMTYNRYNCKD